MSEDTSKGYWRDALVAFGRMSGWVAGPIIPALLLGKWLDTKFSTAPYILIGLVVASFAVSIYGLLQEGRRYNEKLMNPSETETQ